MSNFEVYAPERRGRVPEGEPWVKLVATPSGAVVLRLTRPACALVGIDPKRGDHPYFIVEVDRETGRIRLTPTDNFGAGRLMNPTNRQITLGKRFLDWTGWGTSRWILREEGGVLLGDKREEVNTNEYAPKGTA